MTVKQQPKEICKFIKSALRRLKINFFELQESVGWKIIPDRNSTPFVAKDQIKNPGSQSYKRNLAFKKFKLVLNSFTVRYLNLDLGNYHSIGI